MNLLEKLSLDYERWLDANVEYRVGGASEGFQAGFRAAREMAAQMCERDILGGYGHGAARDVRLLGEPEVSDEAGA